MRSIFKTMVVAVLRDRTTLFWSVILPVFLMMGISTIYNGNLDFNKRLLGSVIAMGVLFFSLWGVGFESLIQRNQGVYKLLKVTPFRLSFFILCMAASRSIVAMIISIAILSVGLIFFHFSIGIVSFLSILLIVLMANLCFILLGIVTGNLAKIEPQVSMYANIIGMPMLFTSGAFYSLDSTPNWMHWIEKINPFHYFVSGILDSFNDNFSHFPIYLLVMIVFFAFCLFLSLVTFRSDSSFSSPSKGKSVFQR